MNLERWKAASPWLDRVLDLPAEERPAWLEALRQEQPQVAEDVRDLLASRDAEGFQGFLSGTVAAFARTPDAGAIREGSRLGAYVLESEVGRGGMGSVWRARRSDGRYEGLVAVKFLNPSWLGRGGLARLHREGSMLARLNHPHIARLLDAGATDDGHPYLVLEYVEGARIDEYCDARQLSIAGRLALFQSVLDAVAHAHSHLVIHRDLKPANVLVTAVGAVKLLDFGIAKLATGDDPGLTRESGQALTPAFAAPEQVRNGDITTATDVYALGLLLYTLLVGRHPFAGEGTSSAELLQAMLAADAPRASSMVRSGGEHTRRAHDIAGLRATTPERLGHRLQGDLDNILAKALRKKPEERYSTAAALGDDLRRHLLHQPVAAQADRLGYRARKFVRRNRVAVSAVAVTLLALVAGTAGTAWQAREARRQRDEANRQRDEATFEARRAEAGKDFLQVLLLGNDADERPLTADERLERGAVMLEQQYQDDPGFAGRMIVEFARQLRSSLDVTRPIQMLDRAYAMGQASGDAELMASALCTAAYAEAAGGMRAAPEGRLAEARTLIAGLSRPRPLLEVDCNLAEAQVADRAGDSARALQLLGASRGILERTGNAFRSVYTSTLMQMGGVYLYNGRERDAYEMTAIVKDMHERYGRRGTAAHLMATQNSATVLAWLGEVRASLALQEEVEQRSRDIDGDVSAPLRISEAGSLIRVGRAQEASGLIEEVLPTVRASGNASMLRDALYTRAWAAVALNETPRALALLEEADAADRNPNPDARHFGWQQGFVLRATLDKAQGRSAVARRRLDALLAIWKYPGLKPGRNAVRQLWTAAQASLAVGDYMRAARFAEDMHARALAVARGPETSADVGEALLIQASARLALGDPAAARALLGPAIRCLSNGLGDEAPLTRDARQLLDRLSGR